MPSSRISDDLWRHQNPAAAQLPWRVRRRLWLSALALLIVVVALPAVQHGGAFEAQIRAADGGWDGRFIESAGGSEGAISGGTVSADVSGTTRIVNAGSSTVRVLDITVSGNGFRFDHATSEVIGTGGAVGTTSGTPIRLASHDVADLTLYFHITDCHVVSAAQQFATIRIDSWRGHQSVRVALPTVRHSQGGWATTSPTDPQGISSVRYLADAVCGIGMDPG